MVLPHRSNPEFRLSRQMARGGVLLTLTILGNLVWACVPQGVGSPQPPLERVDHHLHILSPELLIRWRAAGGGFPLPDSAYVRGREILRRAEAQGGLLISMGHALGSPSLRRDLGLTPQGERDLVRGLHDHMAREVASLEGRAVAFCSVPLLQPWALDELRRCREELGILGVKLHLPVSGVDLRRPEHLSLVASIARNAAAVGAPLMIHLAPPVGHLTAGEVRAFFRDVVLPNRGLEMILAHLGGNGGYRASARRVLAELIRLTEDEAPGYPLRVRLELSGVILTGVTLGVPPLSIRDARDLVADLRRVGLERVLFGSDYPVFSGSDVENALRTGVPFHPWEVDIILRNRGAQ
ncbi:MAG: amidohydrolase family protein [Gemmatimonadota bacterium]